MSGSTALRLLPEFETSLCQISGIRAVRVVTGPDRKPIEIHVLASRDKAPKQVVRDVQSLAMAEFDLEIDHRIVSVVQLDGDDESAVRVGGSEPQVANRVTIAAIAVESAALYAQVIVTLNSGETSVTGASKGAVGVSNRPRLVARATLAAVGQLIELDAAEIDQAQVVSVGGRDIAVCTVQFVTARGDQVVCGSAVVRGDAADAIARAVLDALNRRMPT